MRAGGAGRMQGQGRVGVALAWSRGGGGSCVGDALQSVSRK